jgi:hypothetical protein
MSYARGKIIPTSIRNSGIGTIYYARGVIIPLAYEIVA